VQPGTRLGPYQIAAMLGSGGMGEVYRARDTRLNRDVAIKILPDSVVHDPDRLARFEREAKVLAALNHALIAHVYGLEESNGRRAIVMELVEGSTLEARIAQGPIPVPEVLHIARQLAEALETAHELGIVHRDLKPGNLRLTADGRLKILDFARAEDTLVHLSTSTTSDRRAQAMLASLLASRHEKTAATRLIAAILRRSTDRSSRIDGGPAKPDST
jgi:eukaryotic-like serine/threonine-protein kinase